MDWEALRWRVVSWEYIPPDSRERVITFLTVPEIVALNNAMTTQQDEEEDGLRDQLIKSYVGAKIPAFDTYPFMDKNNFEGLRWVMKAGIDLQGLNLSLTAEEVVPFTVTDTDSVLWHLVDRRVVDIAELCASKSRGKDTTHFCEEFEEPAPTLFLAAGRACVNVVRSLMKKEINADATISKGRTPMRIASYRGHVEVVRVLVEKGANINKADTDGATPSYIASEQGHVEVVRVLAERGADINKADNNGATPLFAASQEGHVEVVRVLVEKGADINKADNNGRTPVQIARRNGHSQTVKLFQFAATVESSHH